MIYKIDKQKAFALAKELGLKISFDSDKPGVIMKSGKQKDFAEFFPELNYIYTNEEFITKDSGELLELSKNINIKSNRQKTLIVSVNKYEKVFTVENRKESWDCAS